MTRPPGVRKFLKDMDHDMVIRCKSTCVLMLLGKQKKKNILTDLRTPFFLSLFCLIVYLTRIAIALKIISFGCPHQTMARTRKTSPNKRSPWSIVFGRGLSNPVAQGFLKIIIRESDFFIFFKSLKFQAEKAERIAI